MIYKWDPALETGDYEIDKQHKYFFSVLNHVTRVYEAKKGPLELEKILDFLAVYADKHFSDEEQLQIECDYPRFVDHKLQHMAFKVTVDQHIARLKAEGYTDELVSYVIQTIAAWLLNHIKGEDMLLAKHIASTKKQKQKEPVAA